jgi:hypothetical protein
MDLVGLVAGCGDGRRDGLAQDVEVVLGILQRPLGAEPLARGRQLALDDAVRVVVNRRA